MASILEYWRNTEAGTNPTVAQSTVSAYLQGDSLARFILAAALLYLASDGNKILH
jgi:hypothetical protein